MIRRQRRFVTGPLFPRYLFCRFDCAASFRAVRYAPEILGVVSNGPTPIVVTDYLIQSLQSWAGDQVDLITLRPTLHAGDNVEVTSGPLRGLSGTIVKESQDHARVTILLKFLQDGAHASVERSDLRLIA